MLVLKVQIIRGALLLSLLGLTGCPGIFKDDYDFNYELIVPETPVNIAGINSVYDDYNSALPFPGFRQAIYFSSNRNSGGNNYDIVYDALDISYHSKDDILNISYTQSTSSSYTSELFRTITSSFDELGPYFHFGNEGYSYFFFANNASGNFDIRYAASKNGAFGTANGDRIINSPLPIESINSLADDLYPCIFNAGQDIIFCSNRDDAVFNIYLSSFNEDEVNPEKQTEITDNMIEFVAALSSDGNDKCPFISDNRLVFASDRPGGFGGYDLYYSEYANGLWTKPVNLGAKINSAYDDFRPVMVPFPDFQETMLIFSSDRPGGKGGFDLYAARTVAFN